MLEASPPPRSTQPHAFTRRIASSADSSTVPSAGVRQGGACVYKSLSYAPLPADRTPRPPASGPASRLSTRARSRQGVLVTVCGRQLVDLETAGPEAERAATAVACVWRGFSTRRSLRATRITNEFRAKNATRLQCFIRQVQARAERRRRQNLADARRAEISAHYNSERARVFGPVVQWQRALFEAAATKVQRVFRWWRLRRARGDKDDEAPFPLARVKKTHRFPRSARRKQGQLRDGAIGEVALQPVRTAEVASTALAVRAPPTEDEVLAANATMRRREAHVAILREQRAFRHEDNLRAVAAMDLEECAAIIQRRYRCHAAKLALSDRMHHAAYLTKYATTLQRAVRSYFSRKRLGRAAAKAQEQRARVARRYAADQVARIEAEYAWNRFTMDRAAASLQRAWRYLRHLLQWDPAAAPRKVWLGQGPPPPPYGLLADTRSPPRLRRAPLPRRLRRHKSQKQESRRGSEGPSATGAANPEVENAAAVLLQSVLRRQQAHDSVCARRCGRPERTTQRQPAQDAGDDAAALRVQCILRRQLARQDVEGRRVSSQSPPR